MKKLEARFSRWAFSLPPMATVTRRERAGAVARPRAASAAIVADERSDRRDERSDRGYFDSRAAGCSSSTRRPQHEFSARLDQAKMKS